MFLVVECTKRVATTDPTDDNSPKRARLNQQNPTKTFILSPFVPHAHHMGRLQTHPNVKLILPSRRQLREQLKKEVFEIYKDEFDLLKDFVQEMYANLRSAETRDIWMLVRGLEDVAFDTFAAFPKPQNKSKMPFWRDQVCKYILPRFKVSSDPIQRASLMRYLQGVHYFSPLSLFKRIIIDEGDFSWRFQVVSQPVVYQSNALLDLPPETLNLIIDSSFFTDPLSFCSIRRVCRQLYHFNPLKRVYSRYKGDPMVKRYLDLYVSPLQRQLEFDTDCEWMLFDENRYTVHDFSDISPRNHNTIIAKLMRIDDLAELTDKLVHHLTSITEDLKREPEVVYELLCCHRVFLDTLLGVMMRRFRAKTVPHCLRLAVVNLVNASGRCVVEWIRVSAHRGQLHDAVFEFMQNSSIFSLY